MDTSDLVKGIIREGIEVSLGDDFLKLFLDSYSNLVKEMLGKALLSAAIYGTETGNKFVIEWEDGTIETFYLQTDAQTGQDFFTEEDIIVIPLYDGFPHGRIQLELLAEFYRLYERMPGEGDLDLFKQIIEEYQSKSKSIATPARDPNEKLVSPKGDVNPGDRLNYTIHYENEGEGIAYGVYIIDALDEDLDRRIYTISVTTKDRADNQASSSTTVLCPHDQRKK